MTSVLVTGGSGFIGKHVLKTLSDWGNSWSNWDIKDGFDLFGIDYNIPEIKKHVFDVMDFQSIIHMAANLEILNVDPEKEIDLNIRGTIHMLEVARKMDIPKFVFISSADCYGEPHVTMEGYHDGSNVRWSEENDILNPFWSYASSKIAGEVYCKQYEELYGIKTVIIRPSIVTGIGEWYGRFVTLSMARIKMGEPILVFGSGGQTRDFVPVQQVAKTITRAATVNTGNFNMFNAGTGKATSINEMANMLKEIAKINHNIEAEIKYVDPPVGELGRKPHEQINQRLGYWHTKENLNIYPEQYSLYQTLVEEMKWIMGMPMSEFNQWKEKPRY